MTELTNAEYIGYRIKMLSESVAWLRSQLVKDDRHKQKQYIIELISANNMVISELETFAAQFNIKLETK